MEEGRLTREELLELTLILFEEEGFELYEPEAEGEEYLPDFIAVYENEDGETHQIAVVVEDCDSLKSEEAEKRAKAVAEHVRRSGEGYIFIVPMECEEEGSRKFEEWGLGDVAEFVPIGVEFEEEEEEN